MRRLALAAALAVALAAPALAAAFTPTDPLTSQQWYLGRDHAFDLWPDAPPTNLQQVRVAVVDTGIDLHHPDLAKSLLWAKSFVGGTVDDTVGHGTFVAGIIAAQLDNGMGIAGMAFPAKLIVAKVVRDDGSIEPEDEAAAIRWAVQKGARVINLSIGGLRDPLDPKRDTYSAVEQAAVDYAYSKGAVVVAAVGNADQAPRTPWSYASYPAALPHVVGVSAVDSTGAVPDFSNRDAVFNDIAAPGEDIVSTLPRSLTAEDPACVDQGYSPCGGADFANAEGTSFAAPQVSAAAALVLSARPDLRPEQVAALLERTADDDAPTTGCAQCVPGRDPLTGWGTLDVAAAVHAAEDNDVPMPRDALEPNDDAGTAAPRLWGTAASVKATIDYWDDQVDVYRVRLAANVRLDADVDGPPGAATKIVLWNPATTRVDGLAGVSLRKRLAQSVGTGIAQTLSFRAARAGWYYVEVKATAPGAGPYTLRLTKSAA